MARKLVFCLACLLLWPAGAILNGQMAHYVSLLLWWLASQSGATHTSFAVYQTHTWLPLTAADGFVLGLISRERLRQAAMAFMARFKAGAPRLDAQPEWSLRRPVFWAWVLPTVVFLVRFATLRHTDQSVLGAVDVGPSRWQHFFGPPPLALSPEFVHWFTDRFVITGPMLFLLAYPAAVWVRTRWSQHAADERQLTTDTLGT
jgi:hypothetical protein